MFILSNIMLNIVKILVKILKYSGVLSFIILQTIMPVYSVVNISIINKAGSNTNKLNSANGIPIININQINGKGQSFNEFDILNVGKEGLIFNNSSKDISTELAGWIAANGNLKVGQEATLIVNTVKSKRSELLGYMEVAGKKSDLIILNQNGIICDGCGFINVNKGILSTGRGVIDSGGNFIGIIVDKGEIEIGRGGFNGQKANRVDLISQQLKLNGEIRANNISASLGNQEYDYQKDSYTASQQQNQNASYVISSNEFGGMYGNAIRLINHNDSIGVNIDFNMATSGSNITIDSAGNLKINSKVSSKQDININGKKVEITKNANVYAGNNSNLKGENFNLSGSLGSGNSLALNFNTMYINNFAKLYSKGSIFLEGQNLYSNGEIEAGKGLNIIVDIMNLDALGTLNTKDDIIFKVKDRTNIDGKVFSEGNININSPNLYINKNADILAYKNIDLQGNQINLLGNISAKNNILLKGDSLNLSGVITSVNNINLNGNNIEVTGAKITGLNLDILGNGLNITQGSILNSQNYFNINLNNNFNIYSGVQIGSGGNFNIKAQDVNIYAGGKLSSDGSLDITANNVFVGVGNSVAKDDNQETYLSGNKGLTINSSGKIEVQAKGNLTTKGDMWLYSDNIINRGFLAGDNLFFRVWNLQNLGNERIGNSYNSYNNMGIIYAINNIDIKGKDGSKAKNVLNSSAEIKAKNGTIDITTTNFENTLSWWQVIENVSGWHTIYENRLMYESGWIDDGQSGDKYRHKDQTYQSLYEQYITYQLYGSKAAILSAGGNINITADNVVNRSSNITAVGKINIEAKNFKNETVAKQNYTKRQVKIKNQEYREFARRYKCWHWNQKYCHHDWEFRDITNIKNSERTETIYGKNNTLGNSLISASGNINIKASQQFNNGSIKANSQVDNGKDINWDISSGVGNGAIIIGEIPAINIDGNMFYPSDGTNGYVIETNPWFTSEQNFKASEYYLGLLGLYPSSERPILGGGFVDLEVVTNQVIDKIGKEVLDDYSSKEEQLEALMQAGIDVKDELGLIAGQSLNDEQLSNLKQPIVWWVYQEINGQKVLVPQVFFPKDFESTYDKNQNNNNSNIVSGGEVTIEVGGNASNGGNIIADDGINITVEDNLDNSGNIINKDKSEEHQQNIDNINKEIESNVKEAEKLGEEYDTINKTYESKNAIYEQNLNKFNAKEAEYNALLSKIQAMHSKYQGKVWTEDAILNEKIAKENAKLEIIALDLQTMQNDLSLYSNELNKLGEQLNSKAQTINQLADASNALVDRLENYVDNEVDGIEISSGNINNSGSINGDKIIIDSKNKFNDILGNISGSFKTDITAKEINLTGSNLQGSELNLNADNINIKAYELHDITFYRNHNQATGLISSNIMGGNINLNSNNNILISSSNISGDSLSLDAGGNLTITAQKIIKKLNSDEAKDIEIVYTDASSQQQATGKLSEVDGAQLVDAYEINNIGSNIMAETSLSLKSGNNILIEGSNLFSNGLLSLTAKKDITIKSLEDERHVEYEVNQSSTSTTGKWYKKSKSTTTTHDVGDMYATINQNSNILGGTVIINAENDVTLAGANVGIVEKTAEDEEENSTNTNNNNEDNQNNNPKNDNGKDAKIKEGSVIINAGNNFNQLAVHDSMNLSLDSNMVEKTKGIATTTLIDNVKNAGDTLSSLTHNSGFLGKSSNDGIKALTAFSNTSDMLGAIGNLTNLASATYSDTTSTTNTKTNLSTTTVVSSSIFGDNVSISAGNNLTVEAGNLNAKENLSLDAINDVVIKESYNSRKQSQSVENNTTTTSVGASVSVTGVSANVSVTNSQTNSQNNSSSKTVVGSNLSGGNISINAGGNAHLTSANLNSSGDINLSAKNDVIIDSAQNISTSSYSSTSHSESISVSANVNFAGGGGGSVSGSVSGSSSSGKSKEVVYSQGNIVGGGNVSVKAGNDFSMKGGNIEAGGNASVDANNISIASVQDSSESSSEGSSWGVSASIGFTKEGKGKGEDQNNEPTPIQKTGTIGANIGQNKSSSSSKTTNNVAGISGSNVNINASGDMTLVGATIGGSESTNVDVAGNLNVVDLKDTSNSSSSGYNVGYTYTHSFGGKDNKDNKDNKDSNTQKDSSAQKDSGVPKNNNQKSGVIGSLKNANSKLSDMASHPLSGWEVSANKNNKAEATVVHGAIASNGNINAGSVSINNEASGSEAIFSNVHNNKELLYRDEDGYNFKVSPKEFFNNAASAIDTVKVGTEITLKTGFYAVESGKFVGQAIANNYTFGEIGKTISTAFKINNIEANISKDIKIKEILNNNNSSVEQRDKAWEIAQVGNKEVVGIKTISTIKEGDNFVKGANVQGQNSNTIFVNALSQKESGGYELATVEDNTKTVYHEYAHSQGIVNENISDNVGEYGLNVREFNNFLYGGSIINNSDNTMNWLTNNSNALTNNYNLFTDLSTSAGNTIYYSSVGLSNNNSKIFKDLEKMETHLTGKKYKPLQNVQYGDKLLDKKFISIVQKEIVKRLNKDSLDVAYMNTLSGGKNTSLIVKGADTINSYQVQGLLDGYNNKEKDRIDKDLHNYFMFAYDIGGMGSESLQKSLYDKNLMTEGTLLNYNQLANIYADTIVDYDASKNVGFQSFMVFFTNSNKNGLQVIEGFQYGDDYVSSEEIINNTYHTYKTYEEMKALDVYGITGGINSGFRSASGNKKAGGQDKSGHLLGLAMDIHLNEEKIYEAIQSIDKDGKIKETTVGREYFNKVGLELGDVNKDRGDSIREAFIEQSNSQWGHIAINDKFEGGSNAFKEHANVGYIQTNKNNVCGGSSSANCVIDETWEELYKGFTIGFYKKNDITREYENHGTFQPESDSVGGNMGDLMFAQRDEYYESVEAYKKLKKDMESMFFYSEIIKPSYPFSTLNISKGVY